MDLSNYVAKAQSEIDAEWVKIKQAKKELSEYKQTLLKKERKVRDREKAVEVQSDKVSREIKKLEKLQSINQSDAELGKREARVESEELRIKELSEKAQDMLADAKHIDKQNQAKEKEIKEKAANYKKKIIAEFQSFIRGKK